MPENKNPLYKNGFKDAFLWTTSGDTYISDNELRYVLQAVLEEMNLRILCKREGTGIWPDFRLVKQD